ncbi:ABC transporter permease [Rhodococcus qingshengii]|uniref:ABC transporter permease n=1 Tax=Rhodococcus baikonurensis TaxID=172041 RepID=A0ABV5XRV0_9NOCA|nr:MULTISPECIES: ABC transporter permease [Rhodococcus]MDF2899432.1 antibiotic transporter [Rhodococcus erythropolis]RAL34374.1 antibiotic transporter [Rhodococcus sp. AQ5-07]AZI61301.1 antibiotic transporter [Rhodococcus sp. NJ-530]KPH17498.1 antibiotic transporter [Rhodococcus sp. ADH]KZF17645.1 antibiotic transporter [Rhodococcus sp. EPR-134]
MTTTTKYATQDLALKQVGQRSITVPNAARIGRHRRPQPSAVTQWWTLTGRTVRAMIRRHELLVAIVAPLIFTVGFYLPLKFVMQLQGINYAQFLMPIIVLQAMAFTSISAAQMSATERITGFSSRMQTMPVFGPVPLFSRMSSGFLRSVVSLTAAVIYGYAIGFRFVGGLSQAMLFCVIALTFSTCLSLGGDAIGSLSKSPQATSQALTLPQLILGMLSCGFVPESGFPEWIRPFVRNQPVSQFSYAMRDLAAGTLTPNTLVPVAAWSIGLIAVCGPLAYWASTRRA